MVKTMLRPAITLASYWLGHQALADNFLVRPCCDALFDSNQRALTALPALRQHDLRHVQMHGHAALLECTRSDKVICVETGLPAGCSTGDWI